jgi:integrase
MTVRARSGGWQADLQYKGARHRAQFASQQEALQWEADTRAALVAGRPLPVATGAASTAVTLGELRDITVRQVWRGLRSEEDATRAADQAVDYFGRHTLVQSITSRQIAEWADDLAASGIASGTVNRKLAGLSRMLHLARSQQMIVSVPHIARRREARPRDRFLTADEVTRLAALLEHWARPDHAALVLFLADTGARLGEALTLRAMDVSADRVVLGAVQSKTDESRVVPLTRRLQSLLPAYVARAGAPHEPVWPVNRSTFKKTYARAVAHLKLGDDVCVHTLRHTCASWLVTRGVDLRRVKDWLGHRDIATTLRYAKLAPTALFDAVKVLDAPAD